MDDKRGVAAALVERRYLPAFVLVSSLFFFWALANGLNDVLIRHFQKALELTRTQSSMIQFTFYIGYFCAAIPAGLLIRRFGYKAAILCGLALYAAGALLFYPAAEIQRFGLFLTALYVIAFGLAFLETAANPYIAILGDRSTASARLNLAQAFNGLGAVLGPAVGGLFIFSGIEYTPQQIAAMPPQDVAAWRTAEAMAVQGPYLVLAISVCLVAVAIALTRFPSGVTDTSDVTTERASFLAVLRHKRLVRAVVAQFFYVGAQVGIWSFFIDYAKELMPQQGERTVAFWLSASIALLMLGRFTGAFIQKRVAPARLLLIYAVINIGLCAAAVMLSGMPAVLALWVTSFFMSIMFPTIFALGVQDLGEETESGASFLIMAIIGGALIPPAMGLLSDALGGVHNMMTVPLLCFAVVAWFAATMSAERVGSGRS